MAEKHHDYSITTTWTGNQGTGTSNYRSYGRDHEIDGEAKTERIAGSADPAFRGDAKRYNPEELLVASISACHMLWFLHFSAEAGVAVTSYTDSATGTMRINPDGSGEFTEVVLHPRIESSPAVSPEVLLGLHERAHAFCFIARSVRFPVRCEIV